MGIAFLILNPTIMLPDTWREMLKFSSENRTWPRHSYEFMGELYPSQMSSWLVGVPWTFYYVFIAVKTSAMTLVLFLIGLPFLFKRRMGDGRILMFLWAFLWFFPFTLIGGKFTRYFTVVEPIILIVAAVGFYFSVKWVSDRIFSRRRLAAVFQLTVFAAFIGCPIGQFDRRHPAFRALH